MDPIGLCGAWYAAFLEKGSQRIIFVRRRGCCLATRPDHRVETVEKIATDKGDAGPAGGIGVGKIGACLDCCWSGAACGSTRQQNATHSVTGITARFGEFRCDKIGGVAGAAFDRSKLGIFKRILGTVDRQLATQNIAAHAAEQSVMGHGRRQVASGIRGIIDRLRIQAACCGQSQIAGFLEAISVLRCGICLQQSGGGGKPLWVGRVTRCFGLRKFATGLHQRSDEFPTGRAMAVLWQARCARENVAACSDIQQAERQRIVTVGLQISGHRWAECLKRPSLVVQRGKRWGYGGDEMAGVGRCNKALTLVGAL